MQFIPKEIIKTHNLQLPEETFLLDPQGKEWKTRLSHWADGRICYHGGWKEICKLNLLRVGDRCVYEFIECTQRGLYIKVNVIQPQP